MTNITRFGSFACAAVLALSLGACGSSNSASSGSTDQGTDAAQAETADAEPAADAKYAVTIDNAKLIKDYEDKDAVRVTYTFTNNSDEAEMFSSAVNPTVYQDGVELSMAIGKDSSDNVGNNANKVKPGGTITVDLDYELSNTTSPVEVEVTELFDFNQTVIAEKTFNLS